MMKLNKKFTIITAILLSALLVAGIAIPFVTAESRLLAGQKEMLAVSVETPPVQDGIFNGHKVDGKTVNEYGTNGPTFCLTPADLKAIDLGGNPLDITLPSYIYLYMAKDADALYLGMEIQEDPHAGDLYEFTTFLGFGSSDADTMNSGAFTTFKMDNNSSPNFDPGTWMDTQVTALSGQKVDADGTITNTTANRKFNNPVEYTLPAWASETTMNGSPVTFFEAELDFEDAMLASGLSANANLPEFAYFAFEIGVFDGATKIGKIVFNNDMTGKADAPDGTVKTVPHVINLSEDFQVGLGNNADLSVLSVEDGKLTPAFAPETTEYTLTLPSGTSIANVTATAAVNTTQVTVEGANNLDRPGEKAVTITCTAQNGYTKSYVLHISWVYESTDYYVDSTTGSDKSGNGSQETPYATIEKALEVIGEKEWEASDTVTIHINGTFDATAPDGILFGAKTIFTNKATRLPITIKGDSKTADIINAFPGNAACANSYHFDTLTYKIDSISSADGKTSAKVWAGSGQVRFDNVNWSLGTLASTATRFLGDTFTAKVFEGWTATEIAKAKSQNERGNIDTSITLGEGADYSVGGWVMSTIGDADGWSNTSGITVKSTDVEASAILDGANIQYMGIHTISSTAKTTTYARANLIMYDGSVHVMASDTNNGSSCTINADVNIAVYGGETYKNLTDANGSYIRAARVDTINGDLTLTVESGTWWLVQHAMGDTVITGDFTSNIGGDAIIGDTATTNSGFYACGQNAKSTAFGGTVTHNVYGNAYISYFRLHGAVNVNKIVNNISGGTIYSYQPAHNGSTIGTLENNISGGNFVKCFYGAGVKDSAVKINKVINNISGGTFNRISGEDDVFHGTHHGNVNTVESNISGGTFNGNFQGVYNSLTQKTYTYISGGTFNNACYPAFFGTNESELVKNTITGGTFKGTYLAAYGGKIGKIENYISGGQFTSAGNSYLGAGSGTWPSVVGTIENTVTGGIFDRKVYGGCWGGYVTNGITNNILGGSFTTFYGGIYLPYYSSTAKNMIGSKVDGVTAAENSPYCKKSVDGKIINNFGKTGEEGPTFGGYVIAGSQYSTHVSDSTCTIENNFYSGTFKNNVYCGGDTNNATITSITNNFKDGTFSGVVCGGSFNTAVNTITNNVEGGIYNAYFFAGSRKGNINGDVVNNISGGTFNSLFFGGSDHDSSAATVSTGTGAPITYTIGGSIKNTFTGGTFKTGASGAGFGTIKGNVENTLKGNPNFQLGFYGVQATLMDTIVEGNVLNLITKDENGVAPTFPKKAVNILYSFDNADCTVVYSTDASNIGFAATSASGTVYSDSTLQKKATESDTNFAEVRGYVETVIEAGTFSGHYYVGGGVEVFGEKNGYGVINIVKGDPVFNYIWSGSCISSNRAVAYKTYNEIISGTFNDDFSSFNRTSTAGTKTNSMAVDTVIKGGTFNQRVELSEPWSVSHFNQPQRTAPYTLTIEGGTFNGDVYGLNYWKESATGPYLLEGGDITININGGTFAKNIIATSAYYTEANYAKNAFATINIAPTKGDITILGTVSARFANEKVNIAGGEYKLILGADAKIEATSASGDVKIGQAGAWKKQAYVTLPEGNDANITVTGTHCFDRAGDSIVAVKGGVQLYGATMILTDRVAVRAIFEKDVVDSIDSFTFTFVMNGSTLAEGTKASLEPYGDDYYCIVLAKIGANDFTSEVTFSGSDMVWDNTFSIKGLAILAESAWAGNETNVQLAKAMQNFSAIVADPDATLPYTMSPDLSKLEGFVATATKGNGTLFVPTSKGLVMGNAVGIRIYGTATSAISAENLIVKVNGKDVTDKAVFGEGTIDLYVNAKNMSTQLKIEILERESGNLCLTLIDRVDAIAASYPETHEKYAIVQQLLVYIQAAVEYANAQA